MGRWRRLATALEYTLGYSDPTVVGALEFPWPVGDPAAGGLVVLLANPRGDTMYASSERKAKGAGSAVLVPMPEMPVVPIADMDVAETQRSWTTLDLIWVLRLFRQHCPSPEGHRKLSGVTLPPLA